MPSPLPEPHGPALPAFLSRPDTQTTAEDMVARALAEHRITCAFQPVVDARCDSRIAFHEALVRLRSPSGQLVSPAQFLPAVTGTELAAELDRAVLGQVLALLAERIHARISVNVGIATLDYRDWLSDLAAAAESRPDVAYRLIVEITEDREFLGHPRAADFLATLRLMGVSIALDDFGAGTTGFGHFRRERFDIVKIDGRYGDQLRTNPDSQALVKALVGIARHFEMLTVIEYIDNPSDAACAAMLGIDCLQGFHIGRPAAQLLDIGDGPERGRAAR